MGNIIKKIAETMETHSFFASFVAGGAAGSAVDLTLYPLDYIKTRFHRGQALDLKLKSYYKGLSPALISSFPCAAAFWGTYMPTKQFLMNSSLSQAYTEPISAFMASFTSCVVRNPCERLKQMIQASEKATMKGTYTSILEKEGIYGLSLIHI